jgi:hypothetical protein
LEEVRADQVADGRLRAIMISTQPIDPSEDYLISGQNVLEEPPGRSARFVVAPVPALRID